MRYLKPSYVFGTFLIVTLLTFAPSGFAATYKVLHAFTGGADGGGLYGGLVRDSAGRLYGGTTGGGAYGEGTVFELVPADGGKWAETVLYSFCPGYPYCTDGASPSQSLALDTMGNLYGPAAGGPSDVGEVFKLTPGPDAWSFNVIRDGGTWALILDQAGNLYTETGAGKCNGGYVLKLKPPPDDGDWISKDLYDFCPQDGQWTKGNGPKYGLSWDLRGNLYGLTKGGGKENQGMVFQLEHTPKGWKEHVLHSFHYLNHDADTPYGGVVVDGADNVYGSTLQGGSDRCGGPGCGTIYKISKQPDGHWQETILFRFPNWAKSGYPVGTLALDAGGNLYGVAGGSLNECSCGVVFKFVHNPDDTWTYIILHRFHGTDGAYPQAGVILDAKGNLYGTTSTGGAGGYGVVFKITP